MISSAHIIACLWFAIGTSSNREGTWVRHFSVDEAGVGAQYLISLHWALSQFTGGMDELRPVNPLERTYVMFIWLVAFLASSIIISTLTSDLTQMHIVGGNVARQMAPLRKYLKQ